MSNGIVRRIDELGRIVIPKEMRRTMRLRVGDEMEIVGDGEKLVIKKYGAFENLKTASDGVVEMVAEYISGACAFVVDRDKVVAHSRNVKSVRAGAEISDFLSKIVGSRSAVVLDTKESLFAGVPFDGVVVVEPIVVRGDLAGAVVVTSPLSLNENELGYVRFSSAILTAVISD